MRRNMANWIERTRYQASWGAWYVQVQTDWGIVELKFDKEPDAKTLDKVASGLQPPEPPEPEKTSADQFIETYKSVKDSWSTMSKVSKEQALQDAELKKIVDFVKPLLGVK